MLPSIPSTSLFFPVFVGLEHFPHMNYVLFSLLMTNATFENSFENCVYVLFFLKIYGFF